MSSPTSSNDIHEFALYTQEVDECNLLHARIWHSHDQGIIDRMMKVLRMRVGEPLVLFGDAGFVRGKVDALSKSQLSVEVVHYGKIKPLLPQMTLFVGLTERASFEQLITFATILGIARIVPLITAKVHRLKFFPHERERLKKIMIAAAEQSKQFALPSIETVLPFDQLQLSADYFACDLQGAPLLDLLSHPLGSLNLLIGPEAGWSTQEITSFREHHVRIVKLLPSTLRVEHAVFAAGSMFRTLAW